ncbi:hypothetical protein CGI85_23180 [Vibrio parahaemolyticus]|nr:hypothetical protein CGI85_23180 [Vibrio parahaemolyticus]
MRPFNVCEMNRLKLLVLHRKLYMSMAIRKSPLVNEPNKAFKSDSQRMAFFIPSLGFVFTVVWLSFVVALLTP